MSNLVPSDRVSGSLSINSVDDLSRIAGMMAKSGFFADCRDAAQAGVKVMAGAELGFPAFVSMTGIHVIKGKPAIGANLMAASIKRSGKYNYRVLEHTDTVCRIAIYERFNSQWEQIGISEIKMSEIKAAGLHQEWDKDSGKMKDKHIWKAYPKNMLFARCISNAIKWHCPDLFLGAPVYTPEELGATYDVDGEVVVTEVDGENIDLSSDLATQTVSQAQIARMMTIANKAGYTNDGVKAMVQSKGFATRKAITLDAYDELCEELGNPDQAEIWNALPQSQQPTIEEVA